MSLAERRAVQAAACRLNTQEAWTRSSVLKFSRWRSQLRPKLQMYACDPELSVPFNVQGSKHYVCRKCGRCQPLATSRRDLCKVRPAKRDGGMTVAQWQIATRGHSASVISNNSVKSKEAAKQFRLRQRATPEGQ